jgi:putative membrane protein
MPLPKHLPILALLLVALPAAAQEMPRGGPGWHGPWGGTMLFFGVVVALFMTALAILVVLILRWLAGKGGPGKPPAARTPLDILKERFAKGEIDRAEYEERRRLLQD